jgi:transposase
MCLHPQSIPPIPEMTIATARAAFPHGNRYMTLACPLLGHRWE